MNIEYIIYFIIIVLWWSSANYLNKYVLKYLTDLEYYAINNTFYSLFVIIIILYSFFTNGELNRSIITKYYKHKYIYILILLGSFIGTLTMLSFYKLIQKYEVSTISPLLNGVTNILILLFGVYIFNEKLTHNKCIGTMLVSIGIYLISK